jgi:hypothetical protein
LDPKFGHRDFIKTENTSAQNFTPRMFTDYYQLPHKSSIFLVWYQEKIRDPRMPMPALVSSKPMPSYAPYRNRHVLGMCIKNIDVMEEAQKAGRIPELPCGLGRRGKMVPNAKTSSKATCKLVK